MDGLKQSGSFTISDTVLAAIRAEFDAGRSSKAETAEAIANVLKQSGYLA